MDADSLNIAVFGAGSIGCYLGGQCASAGARVRFIGRVRFQSALQDHGLTLTHFARSDIHISAQDFAFDLDATRLGDADIVLVTVKSQDTAEVAAEIAKYSRPDALIISFQNGTGNADILRGVLADRDVCAAVVPFNVTATAPGRFHCGTEGNLSVETIEDPRLTTLQACFTQVGQGFELVDDIAAVQWGKLLLNLNNALNTLTGAPLKAGLMQRDYRMALAMTIQEGLDIVRTAGIEPSAFGKASPDKMIRVLRLPDFLYRLIMNRIVKIDANARSSMLDDLEAGRMSEVQYLQGEIVALAARLGRKAPINQAIMTAVEEAFAKGVSPGLSGAELWGQLRTLT